MAPLPCKDCCRRGLKCYLHCCWSQLLPPFIVAVHVFDTYTCTSLVVLRGHNGKVRAMSTAWCRSTAALQVANQQPLPSACVCLFFLLAGAQPVVVSG